MLALACDSTSPAPNLDGVWGGLIKMPATTDTLTLGLGEQEGQIRGFGFQHPRDDPRYPLIFPVFGSITGQSVELRFNGGLGAPVMRGEVNGSTLTLSVEGEPVSLHLITSRSDGVTGTWGLLSTSGPRLAIRDTIVVLPDGRARRHREHEFSSYGTLAIWSRRGTRLVLEQYAPAGVSGIPFRDSLQIQSNSLVRTTKLGDSSTVIETYTRTP